MRWLGLLAAVLTLTAVVLNTIWFGRYGGIPVGRLLSMSGVTIFYLFVFLGGVFAIGWLSARVLARVDGSGTEEQEQQQDERARDVGVRDEGRGED